MCGKTSIQIHTHQKLMTSANKWAIITEWQATWGKEGKGFYFDMVSNQSSGGQGQSLQLLKVLIINAFILLTLMNSNEPCSIQHVRTLSLEIWHMICTTYIDMAIYCITTVNECHEILHLKNDNIWNSLPNCSIRVS